MPLDKTILKVEFDKLLDQENVDFVGFPSDSLGVAQNWSFAINEYAKGVVPTSTTSEVAKVAFNAAMLPISSILMNGLPLFTLAFTNYAAALALGMAGAGFAGVPPILPINLAPIVALGLAGGSGAECSQLLTTITDLWFKTGSATPLAGGAPIPWS